MNGNTAIFYDLENLFKGYSSSRDYIGAVSLKSIFQEINNLEIVKRVIVQRAYANWSDSRLSVLKREINELGIDPIQIFGFSYFQKKNAADIQLAVDSIDLAYVRGNIDIFVIVSGDGGFSAVAKKLHEYGKYVIGCGYQDSTNKVLASVCDYFVEINDPEEFEEEKTELERVLKITNPLVVRMTQSVSQLTTSDRKEMIEKSLEIIRWFTKDAESKRKLSREGLHLSVVKEAFKYGITDFDYTKLGLSKFVIFLQFICCNTDLKVLSSVKNETKIAFKDTEIKGFEPLPYLDADYLHSLSNYRSILATGDPRLMISDSEELAKIISFMPTLNHQSLTLDSLLDTINNVYPEIESVSINRYIYSLIALNIFQVPDPEQRISDQSFTLKPEYASSEKITSMLKDAVQRKLAAFWGEELRQDIIEQLIVGEERSDN